MEDSKQKNSSRHLALNSEKYTIFSALVEAMQKKMREEPRMRRYLRKLRPDKSTPKKQEDSRCSHHYGYLESILDFDYIPQECLACKEVLYCKNHDNSLFK